MKYVISYHVDTGTGRKSNQDSLLIMKAETDLGEIALTAVCDGMGGLQKGELASKQVVVHFAQWFEKRLPEWVYCGFTPEEIRKDWEKVLNDENEVLCRYGELYRTQLGTTATVLMLFQDQYYLAHVGDSRCYAVSVKEAVQLTEDDSLVARELREGKITAEEAESDSRRNILTECIGVRKGVRIHFYTGRTEGKTGFVLCSDGFWHTISTDEMREQLWTLTYPDAEEEIQDTLFWMTETAKERLETDNISVIYAGLCEEEEKNVFI